MARHGYTALVWIAWLTSMSWLLTAKVLPTLRTGKPPDYAPRVSAQSTPEPVVWRIAWNDRRIGTAVSQQSPRADGFAVRHVVQFDKLPVDKMLEEALGVAGSFLKPVLGDSGLEVGLLVATELQFAQDRRLKEFYTTADVGDMQGMLRVTGVADQRGKLRLSTRVGGAGGIPVTHLRQQLDLPPNAVVGDAYAPRSELRNLTPGQEWTIPVYQPFPPNSPVRIIAAKAEQLEVILWDGKDVETIRVVYHDEAGTGLQATRAPIGREWVRADGLVLQQEIRWGGAVILFERQPDALNQPLVDALDSNKQPRLWR